MQRKCMVALFSTMATVNLEASAKAQPDCWIGYQWTGTTIPVVINKDLAENLVRSDGSTWTDDQILREIEYVVNTLSEHLPSSMPRFTVSLDTMNRAWDTLIPGTIHLTPWLYNCGDGSCNCGASAQTSSTNPTDGFTLEVKRSGTGVVNGINQGLPNCGKRWDQFREDVFPIHALRTILNHEFGHALGMAHRYDIPPCSTLWSETCDMPEPKICSMMDGDEGANEFVENPYRWDLEWMGLLYGTAGATRQHKESAGGISWTIKSGMPGSCPLNSASSLYDSTEMFALMRPTITALPTLHKWVKSTSTWSSWGVAAQTGMKVVGQVGVAHIKTPTYYVFSVTGGETSTDGRKDLYVKRQDASQNAVSYSQLDLTRSTGVSAAFDKKSGAIITSWRDNNRRIKLQPMDAAGAFYSIVGLPGNKNSGDTANVACGDPTLAFPCVIVWASAAPTGTYRTWWWQHFKVVFDWFSWNYVFTFSNAFNSGYIVAGPPSVTYKGSASPDCAWVFAWHPAGSTYYTRCKSANETASLTAGTEVAHTPAAGMMSWSPMLGSVSGSAEVMAEWK